MLIASYCKLPKTHNKISQMIHIYGKRITKIHMIHIYSEALRNQRYPRIAVHVRYPMIAIQERYLMM